MGHGNQVIFSFQNAAGVPWGRASITATEVKMSFAVPTINARTAVTDFTAHNLQCIIPDLKCLFMSGFTSDVIAKHSVLDAGISFINKPFSLPDISKKVREVLDNNND